MRIKESFFFYFMNKTCRLNNCQYDVLFIKAHPKKKQQREPKRNDVLLFQSNCCISNQLLNSFLCIVNAKCCTQKTICWCSSGLNNRKWPKCLFILQLHTLSTDCEYTRTPYIKKNRDYFIYFFLHKGVKPLNVLYPDEIEKVWHKSLILTICFEKPYTMDDKRAIVESSSSSSSYELNKICSYAKTLSISWCIIIGCMRCLKLVYRYSRCPNGHFQQQCCFGK